MTNDTELLTDTELAIVSGGAAPSLIGSTIVQPIIHVNKLLTQAQIANLLNPGVNPPVPRS